MLKLIGIIFVVLQSVLTYKNPHYAPQRSTIVHLFEWKWADIASECETVLGPLGYGGIQVSPPNENAIIYHNDYRPWWERYQPLSYELITRSGNEEEFANMVRRCNDAGVRIYVDAIINHMSGEPPINVGTGNNTAIYSEWYYPAVPYTFDNFNQPVCGIDGDDYANNATAVRVCELGGLKDLNQGDPHTRNMILNFMNKLIDHGVAGFRIDAAKHIWPEDLAYIYENLHDLPTSHGFAANSRPFIYLEVIDFGGESVSMLEYTPLATVTDFKFGGELSNCFQGGNDLRWLVNWGPEWNLLPSEDSLVFIDNHDNQRGHGAGGNILTYKNPRPYVASIAFMLAHPYGIPQIMSSFAFEDTEAGPPHDDDFNILSPTTNVDGSCGNGWVCEHRWLPIYQMVGFRNAVDGADITNWWDNGRNQIAFCRGNLGFIAFNIENVSMSESLQTCLPAGRYCDIISGTPTEDGCTGKLFTVTNDGLATIFISPEDEHAVVALRIGQEAGGVGSSATKLPMGASLLILYLFVMLFNQ